MKWKKVGIDGSIRIFVKNYACQLFFFDKAMEQRQLSGFLEYVYEMYASMRAHEVTLVYEGEITHQLTKAFTSLAELDMAKSDEDGAVQKKVFHVMVECLQNISRYAEAAQTEDHHYSGRGLFMVCRGEDSYHVISGNLIENERVEALRETLELINSLDKEGLKELYKRQITGGSISQKGGAGLGFIDIARKTGRKLEYKFRQVDADRQFFMLTSTIERKQ